VVAGYACVRACLLRVVPGSVVTAVSTCGVRKTGVAGVFLTVVSGLGPGVPSVRAQLRGPGFRVFVPVSTPFGGVLSGGAWCLLFAGFPVLGFLPAVVAGGLVLGATAWGVLGLGLGGCRGHSCVHEQGGGSLCLCDGPPAPGVCFGRAGLLSGLGARCWGFPGGGGVAVLYTGVWGRGG
jgi:hypothetical protein